jgi:outer membrane lipoprotein-sorting protein
MIAVDEILYFVSDEKYTRVQTAQAEALIRKPIKELVELLDPRKFWQIHRSTLVNVEQIAAVERDFRGRQLVRIKGRAETLEVSRFQDRIFKYMGAANAIGELNTWFNFRFSDRKGDAAWKLELLPKTSQVARRVKSITIWIDRQSYMTTKFEYVEADGDLTRYEFSGIRVNEPVPAGSFKLDLPATVKVETMKLD